MCFNDLEVKEVFKKEVMVFLFFNFHSDGFDFSIKFKSIFAKFTTDSRFFETAEWNTCLENVITINPHCTSTKILTQVHRIGDVIGVDSCCQTVICSITTFNNLKIKGSSGPSHSIFENDVR